MRPFGIELMHEGIEARLLLQAVEAWRRGRFLLGVQVHAFVAAVLLWRAWLDALDRDAKLQPRVGVETAMENVEFTGRPATDR